ncbi:hypothetical protein CAC42_6089 [Sphaceloma murrayae]|uniref:Uncharacterized protein n=1 Tax=Sphaceloma murrayae TaxID=2082308 RepID=A0A2K1QVB1_9PEZI|nr:hypothetical protein CAC42_6089 [Sphaceloma murrayae]
MVVTAIKDEYQRHGETGSGYAKGELIRIEKYSEVNRRPTAAKL